MYPFNISKPLCFFSIIFCKLFLYVCDNCFSGARNGNAKTSIGRGEEKKGGAGEEAAGGDEQAAETD